MAELLLEIRGLHKAFGGRRRLLGRRTPRSVALDDIHLDVAPGETLGVVGESGSGKTTLARIAAGLLAPTAVERLHFEGHPIRVRRDRGRRGAIQLVFQDPASALNPRRTVSHALEMPLRALLRLSGTARRDRARELMALVNLDPDLLARYPHELSGGQAQRVGIARALAARPRLLILDEPTSALDVSVQAQILRLLARLRRELDLTYLFISHDLAVVEHVCETVAVMRHGRIVEYGPCERVFHEPRAGYTRHLLGSVPVPGVRRLTP